MPAGRCPNCGGPIEAERRDGATFACSTCGSEFQLVLRDGRFTAKKLERQSAYNPPSKPKQKEEFGYWAAMEKTQGQRYEAEVPVVPPRSTSRPQAAAPAVTLEVLPRLGWFLLLFLLVILNVLHIPLYQLTWNKQDVTLPIIGTLTGQPDLEHDELAATTIGYVTETQLLIKLKGSDQYQIRYTFQVNGQSYSYSDETGRPNLWISIDEDVWQGLNQAVENGSQPPLEIRYLRKDPWTNRPVASEKTGNTLWMIPWIGVFFITLITFEQIGHAYANYKTAKKGAKQGKKGKIMYWEVRAKKG